MNTVSDIDRSITMYSSEHQSLVHTEHVQHLTEMNYADLQSILLLILLYTLQSIPIGMSMSIPIVLKEYGASYESLSVFSLVTLPFSLKLLWAPIVDSIYFKSIGRRKTWLIIVQIIGGAFMFIGSFQINNWLHGSDGKPETKSLTVFFLSLFFLMATQDIAVDGWALTMLSRKNVGYASFCNVFGQILGVFIANQGFIALSDATWCRLYLGLSEPVLDIAAFLRAWGVIFIVITILVWIGKKEEEITNPEDLPEGVYATYKHILDICMLGPVQILIFILFTCRVSFAPTESAAMFKFQEYGMSKADIATLSPLLLVFNIIMPTITGKLVSQQPLRMFLGGTIFKVVTSLLIWCMFEIAVVEYSNVNAAGLPMGPSTSFFILLFIVMALHEISGNIILGSQMTFFAKIADPMIGGTYMTLLNTVANLGSKWPTSLALYVLPKLTYSNCYSINNDIIPDATNCAQNSELCMSSHGHCKNDLDGYTIEVFFGFVYGIAWLVFCYKYIRKLELTSNAEWITVKQKE